MVELTQQNSIDQATPEDLALAIADLEQYRERLVHDTMDMAKRAKVMKTQAQANLEPALARIDAMLDELRQRQASLAEEN
jgi:phage gp36-like protein